MSSSQAERSVGMRKVAGLNDPKCHGRNDFNIRSFLCKLCFVLGRKSLELSDFMGSVLWGHEVGRSIIILLVSHVLHVMNLNLLCLVDSSEELFFLSK